MYLLEVERDTLYSEKYEANSEVASLQGEVKKLLGMVEQLQIEVEDLCTDRGRVRERLRKVSMEARVVKTQLKDKVAHVILGMKHEGRLCCF